MSLNVEKTDQVLRFLIGLAVLLMPFAAGLSVFDDIYAIAIATVLILIPFFHFYPAYSLLRIKTCEV